MPTRVKRNDTKRRRWQLLQRGAPIPLTDATEVRMLAKLAPGQTATGTTVLNEVCAIDDADEGIVKEPIATPGALALALYRAEFQITYADGTVETVPDGSKPGAEYIELEVIEDQGP